MDGADREPIAIVGVGCRFPAGIEDRASLWDALERGVDAVRPVPADRWDGAAAGLAEAALLDDIARFDAAFFRISEREAVELDPAQRLLLVVAWEALEDAALPADGLRGSATGVFVGIGASEYGRRHLLSGDPERITPYSGTGAFASVAAGRIAYALGLRGPALAVDTACSSSLVAVHLAMRSLRSGETNLALAGGATVRVEPALPQYFGRLGMIAADCRSRTFDVEASGYGVGEGVALVALERLRDARAAGRRVLAVLLGSAVNQDGRSNGLTAPSGRAQQQVLRAALADAGVDARAVGYVEAHGAGTLLGDAVEVGALQAVYGHPGLRFGSVKTNLGHTSFAAGVAGLLKAVLAIRRGCIPPQLHLRELSPRIHLMDGVEVPTEPTPWPVPLAQRCAAVSAFGLAGTNAHVILRGADEPDRAADPPPPHLLALSARSEGALRDLASRVAELLRAGVPAGRVCSAAVRGRARLKLRLAVVGGGGAALAERLEVFTRGGELEPQQGPLAALGARFAAGADVPLEAAVPPAPWVDLPRYPWQERRLWIDREGPAAQDVPDLRGRVRAEVARTLALDDPSELSDERPLVELGLDSVAALSLRNVLGRALALDLPPTAVMDHPTVAALADFLASAAHRPLEPLPQRPDDGGYPLSPGQQRMWFADQLAPGSSRYTVVHGVRIPGPVDSAALRWALQHLTERHEALRTAFAPGDYPDRARVGPAVVALEEVADRSVPEALADLGGTPFDLVGGPLTRWVLVHGADGACTLIAAQHHSVTDGWSVQLLHAELEALYAARVAGRALELPPVRVRYGDFAAWQRARVERGGCAADLAWWSDHLSGASVFEHPAARPAVGAESGSSVGLALTAAQTAGLVGLARRLGATLFSVVLAAWAAVLHRASGREDLLLGTASTGRDRPELEGVVGFFTETVPLRVDVAGGLAFSSLVARVGSALREAWAHAAPYNRVVRASGVPRGPGRDPLIGALLLFEDFATAPRLEGWSPVAATLDGSVEGTAKFDLSLAIARRGDRLEGALTWAAERFERPAMERLVAQVRAALLEVVDAPEKPVSELALEAAGDHALRARLSRPPAGPVPGGSASDLIADRAARVPDRTALVHGDRSWSYGELLSLADAWAGHLVALGAGRGRLVGLCVERSVDMVVGLLAILRAGAAYVPLSPDYPEARLRFVLEDAGCSLVLTQREVSDRLAFLAEGRALLHLDEVRPEVRAPLPEVDAGDLAYAIYTSGSTGRPKGVRVTHGSLVHFLSAMAVDPGLAAEDVLLAVSSVSFDVSVAEIFLPLAVGARIALAGARDAADPAALARLLSESGATVMQATPVSWRMLVRSGWRADGLRVWCGGEVLPTELARSLLSGGAVLWNLYGPTEATVWTAVHRVREATGSIPIGGPLPGVSLHVIDDRGEPAPVGVPGELWIGGPSVSDGYHERPQQTADGFVADPSGAGVAFRTGDLVRLGDDGALRFLGRLDDQVKVNGFRVELGEIERAMERCPGVEAAAAAVSEDAAGYARVVGYVVGSADAGAVRATAAELLPPYMVPNRVVRITELPLTPSRKLDRAALGEGPPQQRADPNLRATVRAEIASVLGLPGPEAVPPSTPLGELGLDSLRAVELRTRLARRAGLELHATVAFDHPTADALAVYLRERTGGAWPARPEEVRARAPDEPVAIVGVACRFPGGGASLEGYWAHVRSGRDAIGPVPPERWDAEASFDPERGVPGRSYVRRAAFLDDLDRFDAPFFGVGDVEAATLDPQQRMVLELVWEALEHAGIDPERLVGSQTGVFLGMTTSEYALRLDLGGTDATTHLVTSTDSSFAAGRVAHTFGFGGPALTVNTACSSSLVALHQACTALRRSECQRAVAGGANALVAPEVFAALCATQALAADGRSKTFAASADGYGRGEGGGIAVLRLLSEARADGDRVLAVVRGSAVNHDGRASHLTAPSGPAQERVLRAALASAGLSPVDVDYLECHGTGTPLGDPIEVRAAGAVYGAGRPLDAPLWLGAVKPCIGHLEAAAGIAGVLKLVAALQHEAIPAQPIFDALNPELPLAELPLAVVRSEVPWPRTERRRVGAVSAFGLSGTNAHALIEEAPPEPDPVSVHGRPAPGPRLVVASARTAAALERRVADLGAHLRSADASVSDVAYTLSARRGHHRHRVAWVASDVDELLGQLADPAVHGARGELPEGTAWLFAGQGAQRPGMGRALAAAFPVFREALEAAFAELDPLLGRSLRDAMWAPDAARLARTELTQPAVFAWEVALAALWRSWAGPPALVAGHSIGELAAAHVAGVLSLADACRLAAARGQLMGALPEGGAMVAVQAPEAQVEALLVGRTDVGIAAVNGPAAVVLSGVAAAVHEAAGALAERGVRTEPLEVSHAFHSPLVEPVLGALRGVLDGLELRAPEVPFVPTSAAPGQVTQRSWWVDQVRAPVRFGDGVRALWRAGARSFVELSPRSVLAPLVGLALPEEEPVVVSTRRGGVEGALGALGAWYAEGGPVAWGAVWPERGRLVDLPPYPWARQRHWLERPQRRAAVVTPADRYALVWRSSAPEPRMGPPASWLVVDDGGPDAAAVGAALRDRASRVAVVAPAELSAALPVDRVLWLHGCGPEPDAVAARAEVLFAGARVLAGARTAPRLVFATVGAVRADDEDVAAGSALAWGLGRALRTEVPELEASLVDVEPGADGVRSLLRELAVDDGETEVAWRAGARRVARLVPAAALPPGGTLRTDGTALVTGGLGALGLRVARWLVERGVPHLVLVGRRPSEGARAVVAGLEAMGAVVTVAAADVASRHELAHVLDAVPADRPLRAVVHAAGVVDDALLARLSAEQLSRVLAPKVAGAWHLHELTRDADLDVFALYSSIAALLGRAGQSAYSAANAYLDALAEHRRAQGRVATSIAWGPWAGGGMARALEGTLAAEGVRPLRPEAALASLRIALQSRAARVVVADVDWPRVREVSERLRDLPLLAELPAAAQDGRRAGELERLLPAERAAAVEAAVRAEVAQLLPGVAVVDAHAPLAELGLDSLRAVALRNALARRTGLKLPATLALEHPTARAIAADLLQRLGLAAPQPEPAVPRVGAAEEPLAIVGMACRFPGSGGTVEGYWELLLSGRDAVAEVPPERLDLEALYDPERGAPGRSYVRRAALLDDLEGFDAAFFGVSSAEARTLDPQQRLVLELVWEALEHSGVDPDRLSGSRTGVFLGIASYEYALRQGLEGGAAHLVGGADTSFAAGRVAHVFGFGGPALVVNTACSSSLVALHQACSALQRSECDRAVVGGASALAAPEAFAVLCAAQALAPDGRCKTFAASADGYGRGEGCGIVVLRRLSEALEASDRVLALVRGTAVNHDGRSSGLTVPSGAAQQRVLRAALASAGVEPAAIDHLECHGTGTPLGDPIEVRAAGAVYGAGRAPDTPLWLGAVKPCIGHLEAASGIAGVIKVVLALAHELIPPVPHLGPDNPELSLGEVPVRLAREPVPWRRSERVRRGAVSAFGLSGTNAHAILEEAPAIEVGPAPACARALAALSARSPAALRRRASELASHVRPAPDLALGDLAHTLSVRRGHHAHRLAAVVHDRDELLELLELGDGVRGTVHRPLERAAWVFAGQGSQRSGMGRELADAFGVFREALERVCTLLDPLLGYSVRAAMWSADEGQLRRTERTQPALFAWQVALAALWRSWVGAPAAVAGHSVGEVAAAHVAGVLTLPDACRLVAARGQLMGALPGGGAMVAVSASEAEVAAVLEGRADVCIAAVNGPASAVLSGGAEAVRSAAEALASRGARTRVLEVSHAFHTPRMEPMLDDFRRVLDDIELGAPALRFVPTSAARHAVTDRAYWLEQVRQPVRFADGVRALWRAGARAFVELGPRVTLSGLVAQALADSDPVVVPLQREGDEADAVLGALAEWYAAGGSIAWEAVAPGRALDLPAYPWQHERYWVDAPAAAPERYELAWRPTAGVPAAVPQGWLVVDSGGLDAAAVAARLGHSTVVAPSGGSFPTADRVLWLCGGDRAGPAALERARALLAGARALAAARLAPRLHLVTVRAVCAGAGEDVAGGAEVWGLGRSLQAEVPELRVALVDVEPGEAGVEALLAELACGDGASQVVWRGGVRHTARLVRGRPAPGRFRTGGTALVTGGLGAVGLQLARWVVGAGAHRVVLVGRRGAEAPGADAAVAGLEALGAEVAVEAADVAVPGDLARVIGALDGPLRVVVHAAGVLDDVPLAATSDEHVDRVLAPKVLGAWHLHEQTLGAELDAFVLCSSVSALLGGAGQAAYGAANAFLDGLAAHRRASGLVATSIAWGPWAGGGMASGHEGALAALGVRAMRPEVAVRALDGAVLGPPAGVVADLDASRIRALRPGPLLAELAGDEPSPLRQELARLPPGDRMWVARAAVRRALAPLLSLSGEVPLRAPLATLGLDSLRSVELRNALARQTGLRLPATLAFDHPHVDGLAAYLLEQLGLAAVAPAEAPPVARDEPVAIVGMACRFPGCGGSLEGYWALLRTGHVALGPVPPERWDAEAAYDPEPADARHSYVRRAAFLDGLEQFDGPFFGVGAAEARALDPQQRLLLELVWEALEHGGIDPDALAGSRTGVFLGLAGSEYVLRQDFGTGAGSAHLLAGTDSSFAAGRVAHTFGFGGPALTVNTACSSSLVALHQACTALRRGECDRAVVGGANALVAREAFGVLCATRALAPDGRCKTFAASADGYGRGEGCGVVVLRRLSEARADADPVRAVVRGSAVRHDGRTGGLTVPSGPAQERVVRAALASAGVAPAEVDYLECHGTGTPLGDPIEVRAAGAAYGAGRSADTPLWLGAVKPYIGHLEAASGIAGVLKIALALQHELIPPMPHLDEVNPELPLGELRLARGAVAWPRSERPRIAAVSAFGLSGTNAHAVIEEPPAPEPRPSVPAAPVVVVLSARTAGALERRVRELEAHLRAAPELSLADVAHTLSARRAHHPHRVAWVARDLAGLLVQLDGGVRGEAGSPLERAAWLFAGGAAHGGLAEAFPAFRRAHEEVLAELERHGTSVDGERFAVEVALAALWRSWVGAPDLVAGLGVGAVAAAHVAGMLGLSEACGLVAAGRGLDGDLELAEPAIRVVDAGGGSCVEALERAGASAIVELVPDAVEGLLWRLASWYAAGGAVDWRAVGPVGAGLVALPPYPWDHAPYWLERPSEAAPRPEARSPWVDALARLDAAGRSAAMCDAVRSELAGVVADPLPEELPASARFDELGVDSLVAVELRNALAKRVGVRLAVGAAFDHPTFAGLAAHVLEVLGLGEAPVPVASARGDREGAVAIIGMACRLPGGADSPEALWSLLCDGVDAVGRVPDERWRGPGAPQQAGLIDDIRAFDAAFFRIPPDEAASLDPQHRLLLELCWEALERAGWARPELEGSATGVFVGIGNAEYSLLRYGEDSAREHGVIGSDPAFAAGRVSHALGLQGPALSLTTACSSALVALHQACAALRRGECDLALAGGVNALVSPHMSGLLAVSQSLSPTGRCRTFDASADGHVRGEGCGVFALRRLADARADRDPIAAVVRGSAMNHVGRSIGLTAPSGPAQREVMREALRAAGVAPGAVGYLECHGTATPVGDAIELHAAGAVYGDRDEPLLLGSLKTNLGHLEAASGAASLLKLVLCLQHGWIPPHLHLSAPNPELPLDRWPLSIPTAGVAWPGGARIGAASAFGFSGTNAHVVVEQAPEAPRSRSSRAQLVVLSARSEAGLRRAAGRLSKHLSDPEGDPGLPEVAHTLARGRIRGPHRLSVAARSLHALTDGLRAAEAGRVGLGAALGRTRKGRVAWLCSGQSAALEGMGRALHGAEPVFAAALDEVVAALEPHLEEGFGACAQAALFALQVGLAALWRSWGHAPELLAGQGVGEIAAAHLAGVLSLEDAARLVATRGRLIGALPEGGLMVALGTSEARVRPALFGLAASIAAVHGPRSVVISGAAEAVRAVASRLRGVSVRELPVPQALHSSLVEPVLDELRACAEGLELHPPAVELVSTSAARGPMTRPGYWVDQVRAPVLLDAAVEALVAAGASTFVELGPRPVLLGSVPECVEAVVDPLLVPSLRPELPEPVAALAALGSLFVSGREPEWDAVLEPDAASVALPSTPWEHERYWVAEPSSATGHQLLQVRLPAPEGAVFEGWLEADASLGEAEISDLLGAAARLGGAEVRALEVHVPVRAADGALRLQVLVAGQRARLFAQPAGGGPGEGWTLHATAEIAPA